MAAASHFPSVRSYDPAHPVPAANPQRQLSRERYVVHMAVVSEWALIGYVVTQRRRASLSTQQELYNSALHARTAELDDLRSQLGVPVGRMPEIPANANPWVKKLAAPLIEQFHILIKQEMRKAQAAELETVRNTAANAGARFEAL